MDSGVSPELMRKLLYGLLRFSPEFIRKSPGDFLMKSGFCLELMRKSRLSPELMRKSIFSVKLRRKSAKLRRKSTVFRETIYRIKEKVS